MPNPTQSSTAPTPGARPFSPGAAFLSYLVPGLGQIYQGRISKGVFFLLSIYGLFFYGMYLGNLPVEKDHRIVSNVYITNNADNSWKLGSPLGNLYNRPHFLGQFWAGIASWPAIWQYLRYDPRHPEESDRLFGDFERDPGKKSSTRKSRKATRRPAWAGSTRSSPAC